MMGAGQAEGDGACGPRVGDRMTRRGPVVTLGAVIVLALIFLWANTLVPKTGGAAASAPPASAGATSPAATSARTALHALFAGRSSGDQVTVAIAINGSKTAAELNADLPSQVSLQGSVHGNQVSLSGLHGASLSGTLSGLAMFGTVTPSAGLTFPYSAELSPRPAGIYQARILVNGLATRIGWAVLPDGTQLGVAVAGTTRSGAPPLDLSDGNFTLDGASFQASPVAGNQTVVTP
jgi:hypothetical protein